MQQRRALGRGLESLMPPSISSQDTSQKGLQTVSLESIIPNRLQPRTVFDDEKIRELADSIKEDGIIQPLIVSPLADGRYELIAGERRLRAARIAGLAQVPVVIKSVDQSDMLVLSLIENIQREDLNPIEESCAYQELIEQFDLTQEEVAKRVGKSRVAISNSLRLLKLPSVIQDDVAAGRYSAGHARAILSTEGIHEQLKLREWIVRTTPTVRGVEQRVNRYRNGNQRVKLRISNTSAQLSSVVEKMRDSLGTKVNIIPNRKGGGKLVIDYYSSQDLDRIYQKIIG